MSDMPKEIWARNDEGYNFWSEQSQSIPNDSMPEAKYTRVDPDTITISRKELEGMRLNLDELPPPPNAKIKNGQSWAVNAQNALIDKLLER